MNDFSAEQKQGEGRKENRHRGHYSPGKHFIDALVDHNFNRILEITFEVFPYSVENHDCIGKRITGNGQQRAQQDKVYLLIQYIKYAEHGEHVMECGDGGPY